MNTKKIKLLVLSAFISISIAMPLDAFAQDNNTLLLAQNSNDKRPPKNEDNKKPPRQEDDKKRPNKNEVLSHEKRIEKIQALNEEHKTLDNGTKDEKRVTEIRKEILRLVPESLRQEIVDNLYERNGLFEKAVTNTIKKMEEVEKDYDVVKEKSFFGVKIKVVE